MNEAALGAFVPILKSLFYAKDNGRTGDATKRKMALHQEEEHAFGA